MKEKSSQKKKKEDTKIEDKFISKQKMVDYRTGKLQWNITWL